MDDLVEIVSKFNKQRFIENFRRLGGDPKTPGIAYTEGEEERHIVLRQILTEIGVEPKNDCVGNTYGIIGDNGKPQVLIGSHLDNIGFGNVDGVLGVAVGLEVLACSVEYEDRLGNPVGVHAFRAEESTRFKNSLIGSRIVTEKLSFERIKEVKDDNGTSLYDAMKSLHYNPDILKECKLNPNNIKIFIEPHAEQGPVLYDEGLAVGIVNSIATPVRFTIKLKGMDNHTGATPIFDGDKDVMDCFGEMLFYRRNITRKASIELGDKGIFRSRVPYDDGGEKATNKIASQKNFFLDIRGTPKRERDIYVKQILDGFHEIAGRYDVQIEIKNEENDDPVESLNPEIYREAERIAKMLNIPYKIMPSGASHDSVNLYHFGIPILVLFGDSVDGLAHNENERTTEKSMVDLCKLTLACAYNHATKGG